MSYDKQYAQQYYKRNREKLLKQTKAWQLLNKDKSRGYCRKRYRERKQQYEKEYGIMGRNVRSERVQKYLANPEYYKEKLKGKFPSEQLEIAFHYLDTPDSTLFKTGREFHKSKERIRQIIYKVLFKIWKMKEETMEENTQPTQENRIKILGGNGNPMTQEKFDRVKELLYQGNTAFEIHTETGISVSSIFRIKSSNTVDEYREKGRKWYKHKNKQKEMQQPEQETIQPPADEGVTKAQGEVDAIKKILLAVDAYVAIQVDAKVKEKLKKIMEEIQ